MWLLLWFVVKTVVPWCSNIQLLSLCLCRAAPSPVESLSVLCSSSNLPVGNVNMRRITFFFLFTGEEAGIPSPPKSVQSSRITTAVLRSRTLWRRGSALWHRRLRNLPRLVADLHGENHHLVLSKRVLSCVLLTCSHLAHAHRQEMHALPNAACVFRRLQEGAFPIRKLPAASHFTT